MTRGEFKRQLSELQSMLSQGMTSFAIWKTLYPTEEVVDVFNGYRGFFIPVHEALRQACLMQFSKVLDKDSRTISLPNLVRAAKNDRENLAPNVTQTELDKMSKQLSDNKKLLDNLKSVRDQQLAHKDADPKKALVLRGQLDKQIEVIKLVFNQLSQAHDRSMWDWAGLERHSVGNTEEILRKLGEEVS